MIHLKLAERPLEITSNASEISENLGIFFSSVREVFSSVLDCSFLWFYELDSVQKIKGIWSIRWTSLGFGEYVDKEHTHVLFWFSLFYCTACIKLARRCFLVTFWAK